MPTQSPTTQPNSLKDQGIAIAGDTGQTDQTGDDNMPEPISPNPSRPKPLMKLSIKRSKANAVRVGHRNRITGLIKLGNLDAALAHAKKSKEVDWYEAKLAQFRPDLLGDSSTISQEAARNEEPGSPQPIANSDLDESSRTMSILLNNSGQPSQPGSDQPALATSQAATGGEGVADAGAPGNLDQSVLLGKNLQCPLDVPAIPCTVWPGECVGMVVGYCGNKQLMQLEVEVTLTVPGFVDSKVVGKKVCSVWKGGYNLFVGERVRVKLERAIGEEAWYEVVARDATVGREAVEAKGPGTMASNDGLTAAPVGFAGQAMRQAPATPVEPEMPANAKETAPEPTLDNVQDLAERERQKAIEEMSRQAFTGAEL